MRIANPKALPNATNFERNAETFILAERLKEERLKAGLTQEQLAQKIGTTERQTCSYPPSTRFFKGWASVSV